MSKQISISFADPEKWEESRDKVYEILEKQTGTRDYPETKSLPPTIFGVQISEEGIAELKQLDGVIVRDQDED